MPPEVLSGERGAGADLCRAAEEDHLAPVLPRARTQIEESEAQIGLLDALIARARLSAPFGGVVVAGDLSRSIGGTVRRGDLLFQVAPLDAYRVVLSVDESQIADVRLGQRGSLLTTSLPTEPLALEIEQITPVAEAGEGRTVFVSSHLISEMELMAEQLIVIGRGRLLASAPVRELASRAGSLEEAFFGLTGDEVEYRSTEARNS